LLGFQSFRFLLLIGKYNPSKLSNFLVNIAIGQMRIISKDIAIDTYPHALKEKELFNALS
jgi:hypothetical protein